MCNESPPHNHTQPTKLSAGLSICICSLSSSIWARSHVTPMHSCPAQPFRSFMQSQRLAADFEKAVLVLLRVKFGQHFAPSSSLDSTTRTKCSQSHAYFATTSTTLLILTLFMPSTFSRLSSNHLFCCCRSTWTCEVQHKLKPVDCPSQKFSHSCWQGGVYSKIISLFGCPWVARPEPRCGKAWPGIHAESESNWQ